MLEASIDPVRKVNQQLACIGRGFLAHHCSRPFVNLTIHIHRISLHVARQSQQLRRPVVEGICPSEFFDLKVANIRLRMLDADGALESKLLGAAGESRNIYMVAERILDFANACRGRSNLKLGRYHTLIVAAKRAQHHPMLSECHRILIPVSRDMLDGERGHRCL